MKIDKLDIIYNPSCFPVPDPLSAAPTVGVKVTMKDGKQYGEYVHAEHEDGTPWNTAETIRAVNRMLASLVECMNGELKEDAEENTIPTRG